MIYHIVREADFRSHLEGVSEGALEGELEAELYRPANLATDGCVHCALEASVIPVANDYFSGVSDRLLLVEIDPARLSSETRHEAAAPLEGGGTAHLRSAAVFPHVYGPIECAAITGVGALCQSATGYEWPDSLVSMDTFRNAAP